jgi:hypothetical protein
LTAWPVHRPTPPLPCRVSAAAADPDGHLVTIGLSSQGPIAREGPMTADIIKLHNGPIDLTSDEGNRFIVDATRAGEGLITDKDLQEKYELSAADLRAIAKDPAIGKAIRAERERRMLNGRAARELAAKAFVKGPAVLEQIMTGAESPKHKIDAIRELRATATGGGDEQQRTGEKFSIVINLGADHVEKYEFDHTPKVDLNLEQKDDGNWG